MVRDKGPLPGTRQRGSTIHRSTRTGALVSLSLVVAVSVATGASASFATPPTDTSYAEAIHTIWRSVADDYAPFDVDVDVTTADPGAVAINRDSTTDPVFGAHVLITPSTEVGHSLGLSHDGNATSPNDPGHGAWAPIMGVGYDRPITQWSKGDYALRISVLRGTKAASGKLTIVVGRKITTLTLRLGPLR